MCLHVFVYLCVSVCQYVCLYVCLCMCTISYVFSRSFANIYCWLERHDGGYTKGQPMMTSTRALWSTVQKATFSCHKEGGKLCAPINKPKDILEDTRIVCVFCIFQHLRCVGSVVASQMCCICCSISGVLYLLQHHMCVVYVAASQVCCICYSTSGLLYQLQNRRCVLSVTASHVSCICCSISGVLYLLQHLRCVLFVSASQVCSICFSISENQSLLTMPPWSNSFLIGAIVISMSLHFVILEVDFLAVS